jgi:hypothetical protein
MKHIDPRELEEKIAEFEEELRQRDIQKSNLLEELVPILQVQLESWDFGVLAKNMKDAEGTYRILRYQGRDTHILFLRTPDEEYQFSLSNRTQGPMCLPLSPEQIRALADVWIEDTALWGQSPKSVAIAFWGSLEMALYSRGSSIYIKKQQQGLIHKMLGMVALCTLGAVLIVLVWRLLSFLWRFIWQAFF